MALRGDIAGRYTIMVTDRITCWQFVVNVGECCVLCYYFAIRIAHNSICNVSQIATISTDSIIPVE